MRMRRAGAWPLSEVTGAALTEADVHTTRGTPWERRAAVVLVNFRPALDLQAVYRVIAGSTQSIASEGGQDG